MSDNNIAELVALIKTQNEQLQRQSELLQRQSEQLQELSNEKRNSVSVENNDSNEITLDQYKASLNNVEEIFIMTAQDDCPEALNIRYDSKKIHNINETTIIFF
jgi:hypothetical protein